MAKPKKQKKVKNELVWDNKQREEFLTGFTKRKQQRKKKAAEENEKKLKAEQKRLKDEVSCSGILLITSLTLLVFRRRT